MERAQQIQQRFIDNMRSNPTKWAGIAAAAGFGLGVLGRVMRHRMEQVPQLVIIESN